MLTLDKAQNCFNRTVSVPHMTDAMPIHMVKPLYIQSLSSLMKKQYN